MGMQVLFAVLAAICFSVAHSLEEGEGGRSCLSEHGESSLALSSSSEEVEVSQQGLDASTVFLQHTRLLIQKTVKENEEEEEEKQDKDDSFSSKQNSSSSKQAWQKSYTGKECCSRKTCKVSSKYGEYVTIEQCQLACAKDSACLYMEFGNSRVDKYNRCKGDKCRCYLAWDCTKRKTHKGYNVYKKPSNPGSVRRRSSRCSPSIEKSEEVKQLQDRCETTRGDFSCFKADGNGYSTECNCPDNRFLDPSGKSCKLKCSRRRKRDFKSCTDSYGVYTCFEDGRSEISECTCPEGYVQDTTSWRNGMSCKKKGSCDSMDLMRSDISSSKASCERTGGAFECKKNIKGKLDVTCTCPKGLLQLTNSVGCFSSTTTAAASMTTSTSISTTSTIAAGGHPDSWKRFLKLCKVPGSPDPADAGIFDGFGAVDVKGSDVIQEIMDGCEVDNLGELQCRKSPGPLGVWVSCKCRGDMKNLPWRAGLCGCWNSSDIIEGTTCRPQS